MERWLCGTNTDVSRGENRFMHNPDVTRRPPSPICGGKRSNKGYTTTTVPAKPIPPPHWKRSISLSFFLSLSLSLPPSVSVFHLAKCSRTLWVTEVSIAIRPPSIRRRSSGLPEWLCKLVRGSADGGEGGVGVCELYVRAQEQDSWIRE